MSIYSRYIAGQVARPMIAIVVIALAALLAERMLQVVDIVVGWRGSLLMLFEMIGYLIPHYMSLALPAAFFIAILLTLGRLNNDGEYDAMRAAGVSLWRLARPLFALALVLMMVNVALVSHLQPYSRYAYRAAIFALSNVSFQAMLREKAFVTVTGTTYSVQELDDAKERFEDLVLYSVREDGGVLTMTAERGRIIPAKGDMPVMLELEDGVHFFVPAQIPDAERPEAATIRFRTFTSDLDGAEPAPLAPRGQDEREMTLPELHAALDASISGIEPFEIEAEFHGRLAHILASLALPLVAVPLAIGNRRARRNFGLVIGLAILLAFNQLLQFGESLADNGTVSPYLAIWPTLALFTILGLVLFEAKNRRVPVAGGPNWIERFIDRVIDKVTRDRSADSAS